MFFTLFTMFFTLVMSHNSLHLPGNYCTNIWCLMRNLDRSDWFTELTRIELARHSLVHRADWSHWAGSAMVGSHSRLSNWADSATVGSHSRLSHRPDSDTWVPIAGSFLKHRTFGLNTFTVPKPYLSNMSGGISRHLGYYWIEIETWVEILVFICLAEFHLPYLPLEQARV